VQGDLLVAGYVADTTLDVLPSAPASGWTLAAPSQVNGTASRTTTYWQFAPASPPAGYVFSWGLAVVNGAAGFMASCIGADAVFPIAAADSQANNTSSTTVTAPDLTALSAPTTLVTVMGVDNIGTVTPTTRTGITLRALVKTPVVVLSRDGILHADEPRASGGATGTRSSSLTSANASAGVSLLLKAAAGPGRPQERSELDGHTGHLRHRIRDHPDRRTHDIRPRPDHRHLERHHHRCRDRPHLHHDRRVQRHTIDHSHDQRADLLIAAQFPTAPGLADAACVGWCSTVIGSSASNESIAPKAHITGDTGFRMVASGRPAPRRCIALP
jgi:hypothetical protein